MRPEIPEILRRVRAAAANMECPYCKGELVRKKVSYTVTRRGYHLILDDVPAWVCKQCGETLFDEETVDAIQAMLREMDARLEKLTSIAATV